MALKTPEAMRLNTIARIILEPRTSEKTALAIGSPRGSTVPDEGADAVRLVLPVP